MKHYEWSTKLGYSFLKALLPNEKRRMPTPSMIRVIGQGKSYPKKGLAIRAKIAIESITRNMPATMRRIFEAANLFHLHSSISHF